MIDFIIFFFFKQKAAYELRISDWSSDVCSSDLDMTRRSSRNVRRLESNPGCDRRTRTQSKRFIRLTPTSKARICPLIPQPRDRQRVVQGQRVSVRVDPGGRGIIRIKKRKRTARMCSD